MPKSTKQFKFWLYELDEQELCNSIDKIMEAFKKTRADAFKAGQLKASKNQPTPADIRAEYENVRAEAKKEERVRTIDKVVKIYRVGMGFKKGSINYEMFESITEKIKSLKIRLHE